MHLFGFAAFITNILIKLFKYKKTCSPIACSDLWVVSGHSRNDLWRNDIETIYITSWN